MTDSLHPETPQAPLAEAFRMRNLGWFVRVAAACAVVATALGVLIAPGVHGNASDAAVNAWDRVAALFAYAMAILTTIGITLSTAEIVVSRRAETVSGALIVGGSSLVVVLLIVAGWRARVLPDSPCPENVTLGFAIFASGVASAAGFRAVRAPHTRALSIVLSTFALTALVRVGAWELARIAGERANASLYGVSRAASTLGVVMEAFGQLAAAVWIGTRGMSGRALSALAAVGAFGITWLASLGGRPDADHLAGVLHASLAFASSLPTPYGLNGAASFLVASGTLLAAAALTQVAQPPTIAAALALALLSRGALDAPLRAVAMVAAAQWAVVASFDERMLWASLGAGRAHPPGQRGQREQREEERAPSR
jgi:hypothetical protein